MIHIPSKRELLTDLALQIITFAPKNSITWRPWSGIDDLDLEIMTLTFKLWQLFDYRFQLRVKFSNLFLSPICNENRKQRSLEHQEKGI